jgi:hypothetical protein
LFASVTQHLLSDALVDRDQGQQDVLRPDVPATLRARFARCLREDFLGAGSERDRSEGAGTLSGADIPHHSLAHSFQRHAQGRERLSGYGLLVTQNRKQQVLGADIAVAQFARLILRGSHYLPGRLGESLKHGNSTTPCQTLTNAGDVGQLSASGRLWRSHSSVAPLDRRANCTLVDTEQGRQLDRGRRAGGERSTRTPIERSLRSNDTTGTPRSGGISRRCGSGRDSITAPRTTSLDKPHSSLRIRIAWWSSSYEIASSRCSVPTAFIPRLSASCSAASSTFLDRGVKGSRDPGADSGSPAGTICTSRAKLVLANPARVKDLCRTAAGRAQQTQEEMLDTDRRLAECECLLLGLPDRRARRFGEPLNQGSSISRDPQTRKQRARDANGAETNSILTTTCLRREAGTWTSSGHVVAVHGDELYDLLAQTRGGYGRLQDFGVRFGYERVVIHLEPHVAPDRLQANTAHARKRSAAASPRSSRFTDSAATDPRQHPAHHPPTATSTTRPPGPRAPKWQRPPHGPRRTPTGPSPTTPPRPTQRIARRPLLTATTRMPRTRSWTCPTWRGSQLLTDTLGEDGKCRQRHGA